MGLLTEPSLASQGLQEFRILTKMGTSRLCSGIYKTHLGSPSRLRYGYKSLIYVDTRESREIRQMMTQAIRKKRVAFLVLICPPCAEFALPLYACQGLGEEAVACAA